jgi:hypothetical protein
MSSAHPLSNLDGPNGEVTLTTRLRPHGNGGVWKEKRTVNVCLCRISGEGPTTRGRVHFSRALDAQDAAWCAHILTAMVAADQPVSRSETEALFKINAAATERSDNGRFDICSPRPS